MPNRLMPLPTTDVGEQIPCVQIDVAVESRKVDDFLIVGEKFGISCDFIFSDSHSYGRMHAGAREGFRLCT
jgi:hypothetical protein